MEDYNSKIWDWERNPELTAQARELEKRYWKYGGDSKEGTACSV